MRNLPLKDFLIILRYLLQKTEDTHNRDLY